jgi:phage N-6-adenine-methyltransferase
MDDPPILTPLRRSTDLIGRSARSQPLPETIFVRSFTNGELTADDLTARAGLVREAPELFLAEQDLAKRLETLARVMRDWEKLLLAIDFQIAQQEKFVAGWDERVRIRHGGDRSKNPVPGSWSAPEAEARTGIKQQQVSRWRGWLASDQIDAYRQRLRDVAYHTAGLLLEKPHRALGTGEADWFTPPLFIEAARSVLGEIDLDPATHPKAQKGIRATQSYTKTDNGLRHEWRGRVWLNPPYGRVQVAQFVDKLIDHYQRSEVTAAILLTHNYTDTKWFHAAAAAARMICFTRGRIAFESASGATCVPAQGQAFFYFGSETIRFAETFLKIGFVVKPE